MDFRTAVSRKLAEEHQESLGLIGRLERSVLDVPPGGVPDDSFAMLARQVARAVRSEVDRHFRFEEEALFGRLKEAGESDLVDLLLEEHGTIRATAGELLPRLDAAASGHLDAAQFAALKPIALGFVEQLEAHIHKEDAALLPATDQVLDEATDAEIVLAYA
jgi:hemerythrin-like domain-containing protein